MKRTHTHSRTNTCTVFSLDLSGKLKAISPANKLKANCKRSQKLIAIFLSASFCRWASRAATATAAAALAALLRVDPTSMRCARPAMRDSATAAIQKVQQQSEQFIAPNSIINRNLLVLFPSPCRHLLRGHLWWLALLARHRCRHLRLRAVPGLYHGLWTHK